MPGLEKVKVLLNERGTGQAVDGGSLRVDDAPEPRTLPCTLLLTPQKHLLAASHPSREICPPNRREVDVVIPTDPSARPQVVIFEVAPLRSVVS